MSQAEFLALCEEVRAEGQIISSEPLLLDYLHNIGTVFYREGLFGDAIILDQAWALDAVYAVFDRESKAVRNIGRFGGRFRRSDLADWVWKEFSIEEQGLFLTFMRQCGICFQVRDGDREKGIEAEYIAPDLLPKRDDPEIAAQLIQKWDGRADAEAALSYELLPPGLMRSLISKVGEEAGLAAEYWRDGVLFYDRETGGKALVEQRLTEGWAGEINVRTKGGHAEALRQRVLALIDERHDVHGARPDSRTMAAGNHHPELTEGPSSARRLAPAHEPSTMPQYFVSYAWGDETGEGREREAVVDRLCAEAEARGIAIIRDKTAMHYGERISVFMDRLGRGDRIFIVLSDKYRKSTYCMQELFEVWRNCREDDAEFIARTRVYVLPCARIGTLAERTEYVLHWRQAFNEMDETVNEHGLGILAADDLADYRRMGTFLGKTPDMLRLVQDVLRPGTFEEFAEYGFDDPPEPPPGNQHAAPD
jgi:internalin A